LALFFVSLPDPVAAHYDKVIVAAQLNTLYIRVPRDCLAVVLQATILFVMVISKAARKIEVIVDTPTFYLGSRRYDPLQLKRVLRFVIV
jgi:hypothetical protein